MENERARLGGFVQADERARDGGVMKICWVVVCLCEPLWLTRGWSQGTSSVGKFHECTAQRWLVLVAALRLMGGSLAQKGKWGLHSALLCVLGSEQQCQLRCWASKTGEKKRRAAARRETAGSHRASVLWNGQHRGLSSLVLGFQDQRIQIWQVLQYIRYIMVYSVLIINMFVINMSRKHKDTNLLV